MNFTSLNPTILNIRTVNRIFISLLLILSAFMANAQQTCTTIAAGNWTTNAIWSCGTAPSGTFSGTIIIQHAITLNSDVTITGLVTVIMQNNGTLNIPGRAALTLSNNGSRVEVRTGSSITGQNANSVIVIGTSPTFTTYTFNGSGNNVNGPTVLTNGGQSLPVTLLYFRVVPQGKRVSVAWASANEQGAARYVVERSRSLNEFLPVGTVQAIGTTTIRQNYGFIDEQPPMGVTYYRLRQVDLDGISTYTKPVSVQVNEFEPAMLVLGNPVKSGIIYLSTQNLTNANYQLRSLNGQLVETQVMAQANGDVSLTPVSRPTAGLYLLTAQTESTRLIRKILID